MKRLFFALACAAIAACFSTPDYHEGGRSTQLPLPTDGGEDGTTGSDSGGVDSGFDAGIDSYVAPVDANGDRG